MTSFEEKECKACGAIGMNTVIKDEIVIGDEVKGHSYWLVCECGHEITELDDYVGDLENDQ